MASKDFKGGAGGSSGGKDNSKGGKSTSLFSGDMITYLMFPLSIGVVYYYQVYIKGNPLFASSGKPSDA